MLAANNENEIIIEDNVITGILLLTRFHINQYYSFVHNKLFCLAGIIFELLSLTFTFFHTPNKPSNVKSLAWN